MLRNFIQQVVNALESGQHERAFKNTPVRDESMLFSVNYDETYGTRDVWNIYVDYVCFLGLFRCVKLWRNEVDLPLTKIEKKRLIKAFDFAIKVEKLKYASMLEKQYD